MSYSEAMKRELSSIVGVFTSYESLQDREERLKALLPNLGHAVKFYYRGPIPTLVSEVVQLQPDHYDDFLRFFQSQDPDANAEAWLPECYASLVRRGYAFGLFKDNQLISATDAPDVPYMDDLIVEIGINTLETYRNKGYAKMVVTAMLKYLLEAGKVPIWSCGGANHASERLALSVGYEQFADVLYIS